MFGRKGTVPASEPSRGGRDHHPVGHRHVLEHLERTEAENPDQRAQVAGMALFEYACKITKVDGRIRIEDLVGLLASIGGYTCIEAAFSRLKAAGQTPQQAGMVEAAGADGNRYYFGDLPNSYLWESDRALLSLALGAAQAAGGAVSAEIVHDCMARTARSVGGPEFGVPMLPEKNRPPDPIDLLTQLWSHFRESLELYEVPTEQWPAALGFALQRAIDAGKTALDPGMLAQVAVECAVPMAKLDPARVRQTAA